MPPALARLLRECHHGDTFHCSHGKILPGLLRLSPVRSCYGAPLRHISIVPLSVRILLLPSRNRTDCQPCDGLPGPACDAHMLPVLSGLPYAGRSLPAVPCSVSMSSSLLLFIPGIHRYGFIVYFAPVYKVLAVRLFTLVTAINLCAFIQGVAVETDSLGHGLNCECEGCFIPVIRLCRGWKNTALLNV